MPLTFGLTGMDPATESELRSAFAGANERQGNRWSLVPDGQAAFVIVDMDSMYGPMSWLRLHAAGKQVIGLTSAARTQADFRLERPFDGDSVAELLRALAEHAGEALPGPAVAAVPSGMTPAPQPQDRLPEEHPAPAGEPAARAPEPGSAAAGARIPELAVPETPARTPVAADITATPAPAATATPPVAPPASPPAPAPAPEPVPPPAAAEPSTLAEWLSSGKLTGRLRYGQGATSVLIDTGAGHYFAGATLKPLAPLFQGKVSRPDFAAVDEATWSRETGALGEPQPLARLVWFGALLAGKGQLIGGQDPTARYHMLKWPQTEREYPKHFRVATAMMKGPSTLEDIAATSGVPVEDVADFVNANLATGFAEAFREPEPETEAPKPSGLFGRLRGR